MREKDEEKKKTKRFQIRQLLLNQKEDVIAFVIGVGIEESYQSNENNAHKTFINWIPAIT